MAQFKALLLILATVQCIFAGPIIEDLARSVVSRASDPGYRLPRTVWPSEYQIKLTPYLLASDGDKRFKFDGEVKVVVKTTQANVNQIVMHSRYLDWTEDPMIAGPDGIALGNATYNETYHFLTLPLNRALTVNVDYTLTFKYVGQLQGDMSGFYKSLYKEGNATKWLATTQFQPVHARKAFPCFDEPEFKAVFKLTIVCPADMECISNMKSKPNPVGRNIVFEDTPKMSTYLLAFIVSEFKSETATDQPDFKVWARPGAMGQGKYALDVGVKLVTEMEKWMNISYYTLPTNPAIKMKMDQAAIPDFSAGAMENWGLLTYREAYLMVDDKQTTTGYKLRVANILAHEIAHMWFGDLVTCHWWSDTWLNEGFARYFQYYLTNKVEGGFELNKQFITAQLHTAMAVDSSRSSAPLTNLEINSPSEISGHFGSITYNKGAAIIRMIEHWIGTATFNKGLNTHLTRKMLDVVKPDDLFSALQDAATADGSITNYTANVKQVFESWTSKSGYPVLDVSMDHADHSINVKQTRFLLNGEQASTDKYMIPITYATAKNPDFANTKPKMIMQGETEKITYGDHDWVIFNVQQTGYYRVKYNDELYGYIIKAFAASDANIKAVHEFNRAQLVDDAFVFAREGMIKYGKLFDIIQFLEKDTDYTPWSAAYAGVNTLRPRFLNFESLAENFDMHITKLMENVVKDLGLEVGTNDNNLRKMFRTQTMTLACAMGHEACINKAKEEFEKWMKDMTYVINADLREFVYCNALRHGDKSHFDKLMQKYLDENVVNEKYVILSALGCTNDTASIQNYLSTSLLGAEDIIKLQDKMTVFNSALTGNKDNVGVVYDFFILHLSVFRRVYGANNIPTMMNSLASRMNDEQLKTFETFLNAANTTALANEKTSALRSIDNAKKTMEWVKANEADIQSWIDSKYNSAGSLVASLALMLSMLFAVFSRQ